MASQGNFQNNSGYLRFRTNKCSYCLNLLIYYCCSVAQSCGLLWPHGLHHTRLSCPLLSPGGCSNSCPLSRWCHPTVSSSVAPFSSHPQSFPASRSFPIGWFFALGDLSIWASISASVLPMNIQGWFPLGLSGLISLQSKGISLFLSSTKWCLCIH